MEIDEYSPERYDLFPLAKSNCNMRVQLARGKLIFSASVDAGSCGSVWRYMYVFGTPGTQKNINSDRVVIWTGFLMG